MPPEIVPVPGSEDRLRILLSVALRTFVADNRGVLSNGETVQAAAAHLVDAAWHMAGVTLAEPRRARFLALLIDTAAEVVEASDPAEVVRAAA